MAAKFNLAWTAPINTNSNVLRQRSEYRRKTTGGAYIGTGFFKPNPLSPTESSNSIDTLLENVIYEFRITSECSVGGSAPTITVESIKFICPTLNFTRTDSTITITASGLCCLIICAVPLRTGLNERVVIRAFA